MTKQNFISMSIGSGLKAHLSGLYNIDHTDDDKVNPITVEIVGINLREVEIHEIGRTITEFYEISDCKPILRPPSYLTKEIEHGGEKFVPIVELAKIAWVDGYVDFKYQSLKEGTVFIAFPDKNNVFGYDSNTQSFFGAIDGKPCSVVNQLTLFETMVKYHFDISDLISKNQAIDINTLETNPYK